MKDRSHTVVITPGRVRIVDLDRAPAWRRGLNMMHRIAGEVERDPGYRNQISYTEILPDGTTADALAQACASIAQTVTLAGIIVFTGSGSTARRVARERPAAPMAA